MSNLYSLKSLIVNWASRQLTSDQLESVKVSPVKVDETVAGSLYSVPHLDKGYFRLDQRFFSCAEDRQDHISLIESMH